MKTFTCLTWINHTVSVVLSLLFQRILGKEIQPGLRFFGQSVYGEINLGEDGLPDIVVGSQGMAVVLRYEHCVHTVGKILRLEIYLILTSLQMMTVSCLEHCLCASSNIISNTYLSMTWNVHLVYVRAGLKSKSTSGLSLSLPDYISKLHFQQKSGTHCLRIYLPSLIMYNKQYIMSKCSIADCMINQEEQQSQ